MKQAIVIDSNEVQAIIAEHFGVPVKNVIKSQYSYTIIQDEKAGSNAPSPTSV